MCCCNVHLQIFFIQKLFPTLVAFEISIFDFNVSILWLIKLELVLKAFSQTLQIWFLLSECTALTWEIKFDFELNAESHWLHLKFLRFWWIDAICTFKFAFSLNALLHSLHLYFLIFSCTTILCFFKWPMILNAAVLSTEITNVLSIIQMNTALVAT